jgi:hypothetical protein
MGVATTVVVLAFGVAGCGRGKPEPQRGQRVPSTVASAPAGANDVGAAVAPAPVRPQWTSAASAAARSRALEAMRAFARPDLPVARWWAELSPLLTPAARYAYDGTDPANVPVRRVIGGASRVQSATPYLATVRVRTDIGSYRVLLVRTGAGAPWFVERITPPATYRRP